MPTPDHAARKSPMTHSPIFNPKTPVARIGSWSPAVSDDQ